MTDLENSKKAQRAMELFRMGYNCSQSVAGAWCEDINLPFETAVTVSAGFGGGMGRLREVCGAVSGAFMVLGLVFSTGKPDPESKKEMYRIIQEYAARFKEENGFNSIVCREMLGLTGPQSHVPSERTDEYYRKRPCQNIIGLAAALLEEFITEETVSSDISGVSRQKPFTEIFAFGNFDIKTGGKSVKFRRSKSLEALAYLVDRRTSCTKKQIAAVLFEDRVYDRSCQKYVDNILRGMIEDLEAAGAGGLVEHRSNSYSVNADKCWCDYYEYLAGNEKSRSTGEYMSQFSWSEDTLAALR